MSLQSVRATRWEEAKEIVADALELDSDEARHLLIEQRCANAPELRAEVESLLTQSTTGFDACVDKERAALRFRTAIVLGQLIGPYKIEGELGRGGMGAVYLARRADGIFDKRVAIKVLKRGTDTDEILRRFSMERRILARLDHPNIARLIDAGTTDDGLPYFVMEYVEGTPLTRFASEHQLPVNERLRLFQVVCDAVSYAHRNLIVHRDLKPGNILVTAEREVKLLDFGIAKLLDDGFDSTMTLNRRLTPAYASPEQARGAMVSTLSDVYSLGVLLYELLTGELPYNLARRSPDELTRAICDQEPSRPSTRATRASTYTASAKLLKGDLDNIVLKALSKDAERRYSSVEQFSGDIRRYLAGLPVRAQKDTITYRAGKFVKRHKVGIIASSIMLLLLLGGVVATAREWRVARIERTKAEARFEVLRKSSRTMINEIHGALMDLPGSLEPRKLLLQRATEQLDALAGYAQDDERLQIDLAQAYQNIGYLPDRPVAERIELFKKAIALDEKVLAKEPKSIAARQDIATNKINLADFARARGDIEEALQYNREARALADAVVSDEPGELEHKKVLWNASYNTALSLMGMGRAQEASDICRRIYPVAVELREKHASDHSDARFRRPYLSHGLNANCLIYLGRYDEAKAEIHTALDELAATRQKFPAGPYERLDESVFAQRLAVALERGGEREEAIDTAKRSLELIEALSSQEPKNLFYRTATALENSQYAHLLLRADRLDDAIGYFHRAIELYEAVLSADPEQRQAKADMAFAYGGLGWVLMKTGQLTEGLADEGKAVTYYDEVGGAKTSNVGLLRDYAETLERAGESYLVGFHAPTEAKQLLTRSLEAWKLIQDRGVLSAADASKPDELTQVIAKCEAPAAL